MNTLRVIEQAIKMKKPISFDYIKLGKIRGERIGNPHAIFSQNNELKTDIFQTSGVSDSKKPLPSWRRFDLAEIKDIMILKNEPNFSIADEYNPTSEIYRNAVVKI